MFYDRSQKHLLTTRIIYRLEFIVGHDYNTDWGLEHDLFDLIHSRFNHLYIHDWTSFMQKAFTCLKSGGYLELHEKMFGFYSDDNTLPEDGALMKWSRVTAEALGRLNRAWDMSSSDLVQLMENAGFEDVVVHPYKIPITPWPKDKRLKELGQLNQAQMLLIIETGSKMLLKDRMGMSEEECTTLTSNVKKDLLNRGMHVYQKMYVVYGRKP